MRQVGIYGRGGRVFLHSFHKTLYGVFLAQDDPISLDETDLAGIGAAVKAKFQEFLENAPQPRWDLVVQINQNAALNAAAGVRSSAEFMKGAKWVSGHLAEGSIRLVPWRNQGLRESFVGIAGRENVVPDSTPDAELGAAVIGTLRDAE